MRNLGPMSRQLLRELDIHTTADLAQASPAHVYCQLKHMGFHVSLNLLWSLQGAVMDIDWRLVPAEVKEALRTEVERLCKEH